jgi:hypothetical protein
VEFDLEVGLVIGWFRTLVWVGLAAWWRWALKWGGETAGPRYFVPPIVRPTGTPSSCHLQVDLAFEHL